MIARISTPPAPPAPPLAFDVRHYGAKGDGVALDTAAINQAIEAAAAAGGGTVVFPAGNYLSYSIRLKSHIALYLSAGATVIAAAPSADLASGYDAPEPNPGADQYEDFGHSHWHNSLIWGENLEDISITGPGKIFGKGLSKGGANRFDPAPEDRKPDVKPDNGLPQSAKDAVAQLKPGPFGTPGKDTLPAGVGNKSIALKNCHNVTFRDFTIYHGGHFGILATGVDNWTCDNLRIDTNRDGIDFDCCQNVRVANCYVNSPNDDGICPKASYGLGHNRGTENVTITNCQVSGFEEGTLLDDTMKPKANGNGNGRIKLGTEANGGFRNITISNCVFRSCRGLALEEVDGGIMDNITVTNIAMMDVARYPIYITTGRRNRGPDVKAPGIARNILISNVVAYGCQPHSGIQIMGLAEQPVEGVRLENIRLVFEGGGTKEQAAETPRELDKGYPEPRGIMPAYGVFARHVRGLELAHISVSFAKEDLRPALACVDVDGLEIDGFKAQLAAGVPAANFDGVRGLVVRDSPVLDGIAAK